MDTDNQNITQESKKPFLKRNWWKLLIGLILLLVVIGLIKGPPEKAPTFPFKRDSAEELNIENNQFIQADFIDLDKIFYISKFRSGSGHDFSGNGEKCRSMKHYFNVQDSPEKFQAYEKNKGFPPGPEPGQAIDIFSPVDGRITAVESDQMKLGDQIYIQPNRARSFTVRLFHIYLLPKFKKGSDVRAGQKIGEIGLYQNTDIAVQKGSFRREFISYFDVMPDSVFVKYQARGVKARADLIITKEARDANPLQCSGEQFSQNHDDGTDFAENFVPLSGYISPKR